MSVVSRIIQPTWRTRLTSWVGLGAARKLAQAEVLVPKIRQLGEGYQKLTDDELKRISLSLRYRAKSGEDLLKVLPEAFALVREASRRMLGMVHHDVQLAGGILIHLQSIAEMETGEGKTLTAILPLYLNALPGKGVQLATVNDYLARRDADQMRPTLELLGMSVGVIESNMQTGVRRKAYACDITYGTAKEFGFDFLRDQLLLRRQRSSRQDIVGSVLNASDQGQGERPVQRGAYFILVDEADSILIDEARTPLIISALPGEAQREKIACFQWAAQSVSQFKEDEHYAWDHLRRSAELTLPGRQLVRRMHKIPAMDRLPLADIYEYVERAIKAERGFKEDEQYVIKDGEVVIVDESTGRLAEGRKWRDGLHQAVEAKAGVKLSVDSGQAARITIQDFFLRYPHLGGMTGTAASSARELLKIFKLRVVPVPTNRPVIRRKLATRIYGTAEMKWQAVIAEVRKTHEEGRPVLIGTRTIDHSHHLSKLLTEAGLEHQVLNAYRLAEEAEIVAQAGQRGKITVSTNMAGRGTDIKLSDEVRDLGGLHVIATELHESQRIDRQLFGRCGRQGDPGTTRLFLALDDDILINAYGPRSALRWVRYGQRHTGRHDERANLFHRAQYRVERRHFGDRKILLYMERERQKMQRQMGQDPYLDSPS